MIKENIYLICWFLMFLFFVTALKGFKYTNEELKSLKQQAIDYNYAQYNQTTGVWEWK